MVLMLSYELDDVSVQVVVVPTRSCVVELLVQVVGCEVKNG